MLSYSQKKQIEVLKQQKYQKFLNITNIKPQIQAIKEDNNIIKLLDNNKLIELIKEDILLLKLITYKKLYELLEKDNKLFDILPSKIKENLYQLYQEKLEKLFPKEITILMNLKNIFNKIFTKNEITEESYIKLDGIENEKHKTKSINNKPTIKSGNINEEANLEMS